jgi:hypothetical protein
VLLPLVVGTLVLVPPQVDLERRLHGPHARGGLVEPRAAARSVRLRLRPRRRGMARRRHRCAVARRVRHRAGHDGSLDRRDVDGRHSGTDPAAVHAALSSRSPTSSSAGEWGRRRRSRRCSRLDGRHRGGDGGASTPHATARARRCRPTASSSALHTRAYATSR